LLQSRLVEAEDRVAKARVEMQVYGSVLRACSAGLELLRDEDCDEGSEEKSVNRRGY
jgi:hypothetical protein